MKKDINRIAIELTVRRLLRDIRRSPRRGSRNLIDLILSFSTGKFQRQLFVAVQKMLQQEDSSYYQLVKSTLDHTDLETLTQFGMCVGYNSCTKGSKQIRSFEEAHHFNIPWALTLHIGKGAAGRQLQVYASAIEEGRELGIYTYFLHLSADDCSGILELPGKYDDCAFILFLEGSLPEELINPVQLLHNVMICLPAGEHVVQSCQTLRRAHLLYSVYVPFRPSDKDRILCGDWLSSVAKARPFFTILMEEGEFPRDVQEDIYRYVLSVRGGQQYPTILADYRQDMLAIDKVVLDGPCSAGFAADGSLLTPSGIHAGEQYNLFKNSLRDIFSAARL